MTSALLPVERVLAELLAGADPLGTERVPVGAALGRVLATELTAPRPMPPTDNAAMDGYAVRAADTSGASEAHPVRLTVVGTAFAGAEARPPEVTAGSAATIATGGRLPPGSNAVVRVEHVTPHDDVVLVHREVRAGADVRRRGEDLRTGDVVVPAGAVLGPGQLAAASGTGHADVPVVRGPDVAIVLTGDEVAPTGAAQEPREHQIHDAVGGALTGLLRDAGATRVSSHGPLPDDPGQLAAGVQELASDVDLLVTVGGISKGERDHLPGVLAGLGELSQGGVALRPGKPFRHGRLGETLVTCLPGNPAAALVAAHVFVRPVIALLAGGDATAGAPLQARLVEAFTQRAGRLHWVRAHVAEGSGGRTARPVGAHGSAMLHSLAQANAWMIVPPDTEVLSVGDHVDVVPTWGDRGRASWRPR